MHGRVGERAAKWGGGSMRGEKLVLHVHTPWGGGAQQVNDETLHGFTMDRVTSAVAPYCCDGEMGEVVRGTVEVEGDRGVFLEVDGVKVFPAALL